MMYVLIGLAATIVVGVVLTVVAVRRDGGVPPDGPGE